MSVITPSIDNLLLNITQEIVVQAPIEATFEAILAEIGPANQTPDGKPLPMLIEPWPGGRWFRDLGEGNGHLWGLVQAIKRPTLLEITGPLFMSSAVTNNIQYRLTEDSRGTVVSFRHSGFGFVPEDHKKGLAAGWQPLLDRIRQHAQGRASRH
jgi:uncharacterized protein YndB with AHSA1/START domain